MELYAVLLFATHGALAQEAPRPLLSGEEVALDTFCEDYRAAGAPQQGKLSLEDPCSVATLVEREILYDQIIHSSPEGTFIREPLDEAALSDAIRVYRQRVIALYGHDEEDAADPSARSIVEDDEPPEAEHQGHALDRVSDGQGGYKQIFGTDGRVVQAVPYGYPYTKFVQYVRDRPNPAMEVFHEADGCSGVFVDETHVLTAAHCIYDTYYNYNLCGHGISFDPCTDEPADYTANGTDHNFGYVCYLNGPKEITSPPWDFSDECEFVSDVYFPSLFVGAQNEGTSQGINNDFAVLELNTTNFPNGLGDGRWMAISEITDPTVLATKVPVTHGYPNAHPNQAQNWEEADAGDVVGGWRVWGARQYRAWGTVSSTTTQAKLKTNIDAGSGQSGAPIFYYTNNGTVYTGQAHYIIGLMTWADENHDGYTTFPADWNGGPTADRFYGFVQDIIP